MRARSTRRGVLTLVASCLPAWVVVVTLVGPVDAAGESVGSPPSQEVLLQGTTVGPDFLDVTRFTDRRSMDAVMSDMIARWREEGGLPPLRSARDGWASVTRLRRGMVETIELRPSGEGVEGRRIRFRRAEDPVASRQAERAKSLLPPDTRIAMPIVHRDGGRELATVVAWSTASIPALIEVLGRRLAEQGFVAAPVSVPPGSSIPRGKATAIGVALFYLQGQEEVAATVSDHGDRRAIVLHWGMKR